ncbi:PepSY domain-containing protein [Methylobacterium sp. DCY52]|jgi:hypothetical protein|uniref:PepSY domain-containing protein n=1 Tax=Methylobacterium sp. DCY52 TaxID=739139 RepID=UPI0031453334
MRVLSLSALAVGTILIASVPGAISQTTAPVSDSPASTSSWVAQIIAIVESQRQGRVIAIVPQTHRPHRYDVRFAGADHRDITVFEIDVRTKRTISTHKPRLLERLFGYGDTDVRLALAAKLSITEAIQAAEAQARGRATKAAFRNDNGRPQYDIYVAHSGFAEHIRVDGTSGKASPTS